MPQIKNVLFKEKMAAEGLQSFIVSYDYYSDDEEQINPWDGLPRECEYMQFWAEDAGHAGQQMDDSDPDARVVLVETQEQYEERTGIILDYGRFTNR